MCVRAEKPSGITKARAGEAAKRMERKRKESCWKEGECWSEKGKNISTISNTDSKIAKMWVKNLVARMLAVGVADENSSGLK